MENKSYNLKRAHAKGVRKNAFNEDSDTSNIGGGTFQGNEIE